MAFSIFSENVVCRAHKIVFFWSWNAFLVFDRRALVYSLLELASKRTRKNSYCTNYQKQGKQGKFLFIKAASCTTRASKFNFDKVFTILGFSFSPINVTGVIFRFLKSSRKGTKWQYKWKYLYIVLIWGKAVNILVCYRCL